MHRLLVYILSVLTVIINIIFILVGVIFYFDGNLIFAIVIWVLVVVEKIIVIYLLVKLNEFYEGLASPPGDNVLVFPDPTCLIFIGIVAGAAFLISLISNSIL